MVFLYLIIAFGFAWILWIPEALISQGINQNTLVESIASLSYMGAWGPFVAALVVSYMHGGMASVRQLFGSVFDTSFVKKWLVPVLFLFPLIIGVPYLLGLLFDIELPQSPISENIFVMPIVYLVILLNAGPLQEEFGWRGVLQTKLQDSYSALASSLVVGFVWGLWHLPLFFMPDKGFYYDKPIWGLMASTMLISVLFGWIFNNTNRNMLLMLLFHASYNFSHYVFPVLESDTTSLWYMVLLVLIVGLVILNNGASLTLEKPPRRLGHKIPVFECSDLTRLDFE